MKNDMQPSLLSSVYYGACSVLDAAVSQYTLGHAIIFGGMAVTAVTAGTVSSAILPVVGAAVTGSLSLFFYDVFWRRLWQCCSSVVVPWGSLSERDAGFYQEYSCITQASAYCSP